jgi:hypothetical protein
MCCGEKGIRTPGPVTRTTVFETAPFDHSGISPVVQRYKNIAAANIITFWRKRLPSLMQHQQKTMPGNRKTCL